MIKMGIFNKINDVLVVDTFKNIFQRRSREILVGPVGLDSPEVYASLLTERHRPRIGTKHIADNNFVFQ